MTESFVPHRFNPQVAELYSLPAALIFQFVSYCCCKQKIDFIPIAVSALAERYPYFDRRTVGRALNKLVFPGKENPALLMRKKVNGVYLYRPVVPDEKSALYVFDVNMAVEHGVVPAIILHNVGHWIKQNWKRKAEEAFTRLKREDYDNDFNAMWVDAFVFTANAASHTSSIEEWREYHRYISYRTAVRGFASLQEAGLLEMRRGKHSKPIWELCLNIKADYAENLLRLSVVENPDANLTKLDTNSLKLRDDFTEKRLKLSGIEKPDAKLPKPDAKLPNPDANLTTKTGLTNTPTTNCSAFDEASIDEAIITNHVDGFASSLAGARSVARSASMVATAAPAIPAELHQLNQPSYKRTRKKRKTEKRTSTKQPEPGTEDFEIWFDDLTPEQRRDYLASQR